MNRDLLDEILRFTPLLNTGIIVSAAFILLGRANRMLQKFEESLEILEKDLHAMNVRLVAQETVCRFERKMHGVENP